LKVTQVNTDLHESGKQLHVEEYYSAGGDSTHRHCKLSLGFVSFQKEPSRGPYIYTDRKVGVTMATYYSSVQVLPLLPTSQKGSTHGSTHILLGNSLVNSLLQAGISFAMLYTERYVGASISPITPITRPIITFTIPT
jgi:hypothetical protein